MIKVSVLALWELNILDYNNLNVLPNEFYKINGMDMHYQLNIKVLGLALLLWCGVAQSNSGWTGSNILDGVRATTSGKFVAKASFGKNPSNCKDDESFYMNYSLDGADSVFLLLLQAIATQNEVKFYVTGRCELNGMSEISSAVIIAK